MDFEFRLEYPPDFQWDPMLLSSLYGQIVCKEKREGTVLFWEGSEPAREDLFIRFLSSPTVRLFLPVLGDAILGMMWVDHIVPGHKGHGHMYFFGGARRTRGINLREIGKQSAQRIGRILNIRSLYFFTAVSNKALLNYARKVGVVYSGILPEYFRHGDEYVDAYVGRLSIGETNGTNQSI